MGCIVINSSPIAHRAAYDEKKLAETMVDYSKFNNIDDSDESEPECDPRANDAQRWMHKHLPNDEDAASGDDGEDWADEVGDDGDVVEDVAGKFTADMAAADAALGEIPADASVLAAEERSRYLLAHYGGGPNGFILSMARVRRELPHLGRDADAILAALRGGPESPWPSVPAVCTYVYAEIARRTTEAEAARLRESSEAGAALGWMASQYLVDHVDPAVWPPPPDGPRGTCDRKEARRRCEAIVAGLYPSLDRKVFQRVLAGRPVDPSAHCPLRDDRDLFGQPVLSASLVVAAPALAPFVAVDAVVDVGRRTIVELYACDALDAAALRTAAWRAKLLARCGDDAPVPRGNILAAFRLPGAEPAALRELYAPLFDAAVDVAAYDRTICRGKRDGWAAVSRAGHAAHCGLAANPAPARAAAQILRDALRAGGEARRLSFFMATVQYCNHNLEKLESESGIPEGATGEFGGWAYNLDRALGGFKLGLEQVGVASALLRTGALRHDTHDFSVAELAKLLTDGERQACGLEKNLVDPIFGHGVDAWLGAADAPRVPERDSILAARGANHGKALMNWACGLRGLVSAAVGVVAAEEMHRVESTYAFVAGGGAVADDATVAAMTWAEAEVFLAFNVVGKGWIYAGSAMDVDERSGLPRFVCDFEAHAAPYAKYRGEKTETRVSREGGRCAICLQDDLDRGDDATPFKELRPCLHAFCAGCVRKLGPSCPLCRRAVESVGDRWGRLATFERACRLSGADPKLLLCAGEGQIQAMKLLKCARGGAPPADWPPGLAGAKLVAMRFKRSASRVVTVATDVDHRLAGARAPGLEATYVVDDVVDDGKVARRKCSNGACAAKHETQPGAFRNCARCRRVQYCSRACQAAAWKAGHRLLCPRVAALAPPPPKPAPPPKPPAPPGSFELSAQRGYVEPPKETDANCVFHADRAPPPPAAP